MIWRSLLNGGAIMAQFIKLRQYFSF